MSGSALSSWTISRDSDAFTRYLSKAVNCGHGDTNSAVLLECLRSKSVEELIKVNFEIEESFKASFGPIVDGLLVPAEPRILMESDNDSTHHLSYLHPTGRQQSPASFKPPHPLLFGTTRAESPFLFTDEEEKLGIDLNKRDAVLRSLVKHVVDYYQEVQFAKHITTQRGPASDHCARSFYRVSAVEFCRGRISLASANS